MTFVALLTKELRLRLRRERTIWVIIIYLLVMGLLGFLFISQSGSYNSYTLSSLGRQLYTLLASVQLFLIMFITPAFTSTAINGEKERQTFDLLLCSQLSSFSLIGGKLAAGLANALLLIAASVPLFSLVFFFGGVGPAQVLSALVVFVVTAILVGTFGLFCSTILKRPPVSTAIAYMLCVIWVLSPWLLSLLLALSGSINGPWPSSLLFIGNPILALISTFTFYGPFPLPTIYPFFGIYVASWISYTVINLLVSIIFILLSMWLVKPNPIGRLSRLMEKRPRKNKATATV
jgi:ABC-type transport system involved in multi-copper enzyme maturation permease subunit